MFFTAPENLYALLIMPLAALLAFLSRRERRVMIPSMLPWRGVLALPRPRPKRNPIDLETACALAGPLLLAMALAGPVMRLPAKTVREIVVVADTSWSMQSRVRGRPSRMEQSASWVRRLESAGYNRITLYTTSRAKPLLDSAPPDAAVSALNAATPGSQQPSRQEQILIAALGRARSRDLPVVWISDRQNRISSPRLAQIMVGDQSQNLAITTAVITGAPDKETLFVNVANFSRSSHSIRLTCIQSGRELASLPRRSGPAALKPGVITLQPGQVHPFTAPIDALAGYNPGKPLEIRLEHERGTGLDDDLRVDNNAVISPMRATTIAIDRKQYPRLAIALRTACGLALVRPGTGGALAVTGHKPGILPQSGILLVAPQTECCGLVELGASTRVNDVRIAMGANPLPEICSMGLDAFELRPARLPPAHTVLAEAMSARNDAGTAPLPFIATWQWHGRRVAYLGAIPTTWTSHPSFPVTIAELVKRLQPAIRNLPGINESDNRMHKPATTTMPRICRGRTRNLEVPLARILALLGACALAYVFFAEWRRSNRQRTFFSEKH